MVIEDQKYALVARQRIGLLSAMTDLFCGDALISFTGDLSMLDVEVLPDVSITDSRTSFISTTEALATVHSRLLGALMPLKVATIPLEADTIPILKRYIYPRVGLRRRIAHIEITKHDVLEFGSYDSFYPWSVWVSRRADVKLLQSLVDQKIIRAFK